MEFKVLFSSYFEIVQKNLIKRGENFAKPVKDMFIKKGKLCGISKFATS